MNAPGSPMGAPERVMLLIDGDNLSVEVIEQAVVLLLAQHGGLHVRRAYGTAESAVRHQAVFRRLGIKPMVNLAAGKNSTDIALAVDAIDLVLAERPDVVVIASSDSDFAPLVQRLREKGCTVRGIGQRGKTGDETQAVYDDFTVLDHRKPGDAPGRAARKRASSQAALPLPIDLLMAESAPKVGTSRPRKRAAKAMSEPAPEAAAASPAVPDEPSATRAGAASAARKIPGRKAAKAAPTEPAPAPLAAAAPPPARKRAPKPDAPAPTPTAPPSSPAQAVLEVLPELAAGQSLALNVAVQRLKEAQLLGKNRSSTRYFAQLGKAFELRPAGNPTQVRWRPE